MKKEYMICKKCDKKQTAFWYEQLCYKCWLNMTDKELEKYEDENHRPS